MATTVSASENDLSTAIPILRQRYVECVTRPEQCVTSGIVVDGSAAAIGLENDLRDLVEWNLGRATDIPGDGIDVLDTVRLSDRAASAVMCIVNDLPLVDRREPGITGDDIPFANPLLSVRERWDLELTPQGWRLVALENLGYFPESASCAPPS